MNLTIYPFNTYKYTNVYFQKHNDNKQNNNAACYNLLSSICFKASAQKAQLNATVAAKEKRIREVINSIADDFKQFPQVKAIAIGGSKSTGKADKSSDIDIEIYTDGKIPAEDRLAIAKKYGSKKYHIGQEFFGDCDEFQLSDIGQLDISYFDKQWMDGVIDDVWHQHRASNGYTTCFLHTIKNCEPLYDKDGWLQEKKQDLATPYPKELKENIVRRNMQLLSDKVFDSYSKQIKKALDREDYVSLNHRIAAFIQSYFDILFALNETFHPGEKRLVEFVYDKCTIFPADFEHSVEHLAKYPKDDPMTYVNDLIKGIRRCIEDNMPDFKMESSNEYIAR